MSQRQYCKRCEYPLTTCLCAAVVAVDVPVDIVILQDPSETQHAKNTARLLNLCIERCCILTKTQDIQALSRQIQTEQTAILYPSPNARPVEQQVPSEVQHITTLIILDGTWRKAKKLWLSYAWLAELAAWTFDQPPTSQYHRQSDLTHSLSTLEATSYCLQQVWGVEAAPLLDCQKALSARWRGYTSNS